MMRRLVGLQYLRGFAACAVVIHHAVSREGVPFHLGEAGVDLFFVLSGFLMWAITDAGTTPVRFFADRAKRIVPLYWIVTSVVLAGALAHLFPAMRLTAGHVLASYLFLPWVSPSNGQVWPLLVPGWTLNYEMFFYLLFGLVLVLPRGRQLGAVAALFAALVAFGLIAHPQATAWRFYCDPQILEFLAGIGLAVAWQRGHLNRPALGTPLLAASALTLAAFALLVPGGHRLIGFGVPAVLAVAAVLAFEARPGGLPALRGPLWIGDASYSIYLWHTLAVSVIDAAGRHLGLPPAAIVIGSFAGGIATGLAGYALVERPILKGFHRRRYRHGAPVPSGV